MPTINGSVLDSSVAGSPPQSPTAEASSTTTLKSAHVFEVVSQISLAKTGTYLTAKLSPLNRRRLISVEVHRVLPSFEDDDDKSDGKSGSTNVAASVSASNNFKEAETCHVRIFQCTTTFLGMGSKQPTDEAAKKTSKKVKSATASETGEEKEEDSDSQSSSTELQTSNQLTAIDSRFQGWQPKSRLPISMISILNHSHRTVELKAESKGHIYQREYIFDSESSASNFVSIIEENKRLQDIRTQNRLTYMLNGITLKDDEVITFLIDICSAMDLPRTDVGRDSDPYVTVRFNGRKVHKTHYISHEDNPIWTLSSKSLFLWTIPAKELFMSEDGLIFEVKDYDAVGENESMGAFSVSAAMLYRWDGERRKFDLKPLLGKHDYGQGSVAIRVRRATEHDIRFIEDFAKSKKSKQYYFSNLKGGAGTLKSLTTTYKKKEKEGPDKDKIKYLVRPSPDPKRKDATTWLTKEKIEELTMEDSHTWIDVGSGHLGKVFLEVLSCDNLPNMDTGSTFGNKTDSFVSVVYEDCFARTDVINDCLSPRWMPWSQRAFIFNMMHTSSQLFLGVFDYDGNTLSDHDFIGRVSVDLSNFQPDTVYVLQYKLYPTARAKYNREMFEQKYEKDPSKHCTITIRLRMELDDERTLLLSNFNYPSMVYVNVDNKKDFRVLNQTIIGNVDLRRYGLGNINAYVEELLDLLTVYYFLEDGAISLFLWRSSSIIPIPLLDLRNFSLKWLDLGMPLHSILAFLCATRIIEHPELIPTYSLGCIAWLLIVTMEMRSHNPNPWKRSKPMSKMVYSLIVGKNATGAQTIKPNENLDALTEHDKKWKQRLKDAEEKAAKRALEYAKEQEEYLKQMEEIGDERDTDISTKLGGFSVDPTKRWLLPIQEWLGIICEWIRVLKNIIIWEECYISFWIALGSFLLSIISYFIPWAFITRWALRIIVWVFFGPWMKAVDVFYFSKMGPETDEQKRERLNRLKVEREKWLETQKLDLQLRKERATKLKDFKQHQFGEYVCHVNLLKRDRYFDHPLPASYATPYSPKLSSLGSLAMREAGYHRHRVNGQHLVGDMIPKLMDETTKLTEAPIGKPTKKTEELKEDSIGAVYSSNDSFSSAALKVVSIVLGASFITWFGVPLMLYAVKRFVPDETDVMSTKVE